MRTHRTVLSSIALAAMACSAHQTESQDRPTPANGATAAPQPAAQRSDPRVTDHPPCVISADCPASQHCDLGQCTQDCNMIDVCTAGLTCSPRGRCLSPSTPDADPRPSAQSAGTLAVWPSAVALTERDTSFSMQLRSSGTLPVRYRLQVKGPHLHADSLEGSFTGSTQVVVRVTGAGLAARNESGSVTVYSTLGTVVVDAPIHVGVTGSYRGKLTYDSGAINLGHSNVALDISEVNGSVRMRIDSHDSMLFPAVAGKETTGQGTYTISGGIDATVSQVVDASFGGSLNPLGRAIGRQVRFQVSADSAQTLAGTFNETIVGLFAEPVSTSGHVALAYVPQATDPSFTLAPSPTMPLAPSASASTPLGDVFPWSDSTCGFSFCLQAGQLLCDTTAHTEQTVVSLEQAYAAPLTASVGAIVTSRGGTPGVADLPSNCEASLATRSLGDYQASAAAQACNLVPALACALQIAASRSSSDKILAEAAARLVPETLAPGLMVAKNLVVQGLNDSFVGLSQEQTDYAAARRTLSPFAMWMMQPVVLEYLRNMPPSSAKGADPTQSFPAARGLGDLFKTLAVVDGELARIRGASGGDPAGAITDTQQRAVLILLESETLNEILAQWSGAPPSLASAFTGVLTPLDRSFVSMLEGNNAFGVPDGYVPFVYTPANASKGGTNVEQQLAIAAGNVASEQSVEAQFLANKRTYDSDVAQLQQELTAVDTTYNAQLQDFCGHGFNPSTLIDPVNWSQCGADGTGTVAASEASVTQAQTQLQSAEQTIDGLHHKIQIDVGALAETRGVQATQIAFTEASGQQLAVLDFASGTINAAQQAIQVASNASFVNFGAPLGEAALTAMLAMEQTALTVSRDNLQTAETVQSEQTSASLANIQATAAIAKEQIDLSQALVDATQKSTGVLQARLNVANSLAQAQRLWQSREEALATASADPTKNPSSRLMADALSLEVIAARASAQQQLYLAGSALAYELNMSIPAIAGAVLNAGSGTDLGALHDCLNNIFQDSLPLYGAPQDYVTTVSVRQMLGIRGPRTDEVTGQVLSEGDQFRRLLLENQNLDGRGGVGLVFSTDLQPGNGLWARDVCNDRIASVQAQLVGDFLGDNQAQVNLSLGGAGVMRDCDSDSLTTWSLGGVANGTSMAFAIVQAGVNTYGTAPPNTSLFGQPVARANWKLVIPGGQDAPSNADVDVTHIDDVVLAFDHKALPRHASPLSVDLSCLSNLRK